MNRRQSRSNSYIVQRQATRLTYALEHGRALAWLLASTLIVALAPPLQAQVLFRKNVDTEVRPRVGGAANGQAAADLAVFSADVTPPIGHPCMGGGIAPVREVLDPLFCRGVVLRIGDDAPLVLAAVDWCEIRNDAYQAWRAALAEAAETTVERVLLASVHQHDAPVADLTAERLLREHGLEGSVCDPAFHQQAIARVATALRAAWRVRRPVTHFGLGQAAVREVASNRRFFDRAGQLQFSRTSSSRDPEAHAADEGVIDPLLKTISFWNADQPLAALHCYAVHPMAYYGQGQVSADFVGLARRLRQADDPAVHQVYFSGCSGNVTAGKYNDGAPANRALLAERLRAAMVEAWKSTERVPLERAALRVAPLRLAPRDTAGFTLADSLAILKPGEKPFRQCLAAMNLSWRQRADAGESLALPVVDFGPAAIVLFPGETYVEYQLQAQALCPDKLVISIGYGECATGYIPTERHWAERDNNLGDWCWVAAGAEPTLLAALRRALLGEDQADDK